ncbi:MAG: hypothetical protein KKA16_14795 [Alphaproteobacteria bacterium]|uniref:Uncharacterized protein n=1 Tax=viral metagenome TaxID=1070528 RepID=A0A6H1ZH55_9ZZZZ|nr:hypothetical protein [Alphaproteobacteria bacterium]MBU2379197.1 hypothetical protein [Alphaproteobacteria bacterium]
MSRASVLGPSDIDVYAALTARDAAAQDLAQLQRRSAEADEALVEAERDASASGLAMARASDEASETAYIDAVGRVDRARTVAAGIAETLIPDAELALEAAESAVLEAQRTACADEAAALSDLVARRLEEEYPVILGQLEALKSAVADAEAVLAAANRNLPAGREPLLPIEHRVRDVVAQQGGIVAREVVSVWCYAGTCSPVSAERISEIVRTRRGRRAGEVDGHVLPSRSRGNSGRGSLPSSGRLRITDGHRVELRRLVQVTLEERIHSSMWARLKDARLPTLRPAVTAPRRWTELRELAEHRDLAVTE